MKSKIRHYLRILLLLGFFAAPAIGYCAKDATFNFDGDAAKSGGFTETTTKLNYLANTAFYGMYLVGGVLLTSGAIKLKQGDIPGFAKTAAGGGVMFTIPTVMSSLKTYSNK